MQETFIDLSEEIVALLKADKIAEASVATKAFIEMSKKLREQDKK